MVPPPVEIPTPNQPVKRMVSMSTPASAGTPIRVVISPNDDPRTEQYRRLAMLKKGLPFLDGLPPAALKELAEAGTPHRYEPGQKICSQGDTAEVEPSGGFPIYAVESGFPQALIDGEGRVQEYAPGDAFGELAPLTNQPRGASVQIHATGQPAELMVFSAEAVQAALSKWTDEERQGHYDALVQQYTQARALRRDPGLIAEIRELWNIMVRFCFSLSLLARARPYRLYHELTALCW
jgi:CRP-like cAMP-binding protein